MRIGYGLGTVSRALARRVKRALGIRSEEGASLLELALTLPVMMTILTGTVSFSLALYYLQQIGSATSGAAQQLAGEAGTFTNGDPCAAAKSFITGALPSAAPSKLALTLTLSYAIAGQTTPGTYTHSGTGSSFSCSGAPAMEAGYPVTVTVTYTYTWLPILFDFSPNGNLSSTQAALQE
ncbi:MAG: TadE family protein [Terracidiphilus sp.]